MAYAGNPLSGRLDDGYERDRYRSLLERSPLGFLVLAGGSVEWANPAVARLAGHPQDSLNGADFLDLFSLEHRRHVEQMLALTSSGAANGGLCDRVDVVHADGRRVFVELHLDTAAWNGEPAVLATLTDLTDRQRLEDRLVESESRFRSLVETTPDWVWQVDAEGRYTYASPRVKDLLGLDPAEVVGRTAFEFIRGEDRARIQRHFHQAVREGRALTRVTNVCRHRDGYEVVLETSGEPIRDRDGRVIGYRGIDRDITGRVRAEEASRTAAEQLQTSLNRLESTIESTIAAMAALVDMRDPYTAGHQQRVARLASRIAIHLGMSREEERSIRLAATTHDIGKISVPSEILAKPGPISRLEMEMIRTHSKAGYDILKDIELNGPVATIVLQHHERLDGSGYPAGLRGDEILPESRVVAVADAIEATASHRPYRPSQGFDAALDSLRQGRGTTFDARVVDACLEIIRPEDVGVGTQDE
jgi:PAS domain S-box-containing protein